MASFNKVILMGNMTADPELKQTASGISVCSFSIAVQRRFANRQDATQQNVDFINVVTWRQQAEFVSRYFKKGSNILVCGQLQTRTWNDNQGQKRYATEVVADEVTFGSSPAAGGAGDRHGGQDC
jgi:single-strand DNA-binding protein